MSVETVNSALRAREGNVVKHTLGGEVALLSVRQRLKRFKCSLHRLKLAIF